MRKRTTKEIIWTDAAGCRKDGLEWYNRNEALELAKEKYEAKSITAGIILENNKNYIVVASTKSGDIYSDITMIPKRFLIRISG